MNLKKDYDDLIVECVKAEIPYPGVRVLLSDFVTINYYDKWDVKSLKFKNAELKKTVLDTLSALLDFVGCLDVCHLVVDQSGNFLIPRNDSIEEGKWLKEVYEPETLKIRKVLRNLYRKLHPEEYAELPPFED